MGAVSASLLETIIQLQNLSSLKDAYLGGGTNLAIRYNHRESIDIDLFFSGIIGKQGYKAIEADLIRYFGNQVVRLHYPCDKDDQYIFIRFWIKKEDLSIKVEIMQNTNFLDSPEDLQGARLATVRDIGLLKLMTAANRASIKDIYDLDYITEEIPMKTLMEDLKYKQGKYCAEEDKTIFDQDGEISPVENPLLLIKFEQKASSRQDRPSHSDHRIITADNGKNLMTAKSSYRRKVRRLCNELGIEFPSIQPLN